MHRTSAPPHRPATAVRRGALGLTVVILLTGCGVRLESPPPPLPSPGVAEVTRQDAATTAAGIAARAAAAVGGPGADEELRSVLAEIEVAARAHADALGGVWEPWPGSGPDATAPPEEGEAVSPSPSGEPASGTEVLQALTRGAREAYDAAATAPDDAALLGSIALARTHAARRLGAALGTDAPAGLPTGEPLPRGESLPPGTEEAVDAATYALEVVAARTAGTEREASLARARYLTDLAGTHGRAAYDVRDALAAPPDDLTPEQWLAARAELDLVTAFLAALDAGRGEPALLLAAALDAADRAVAWGAELPILPGLAPVG